MFHLSFLLISCLQFFNQKQNTKINESQSIKKVNKESDLAFSKPLVYWLYIETWNCYFKIMQDSHICEQNSVHLKKKICSLLFFCFHPRWYVYLIWYDWIYENVIITSNIMQFPFHALQNLILWYTTIPGNHSGWSITAVLFDGGEQISWDCHFPVVNQMHKCDLKQMDRNTCIAAIETSWAEIWFWLNLAFYLRICDYYTSYCADCIMMLQGCSNIKTVKMPSSCLAVHEFVKWREMGLMTWAASKVPVDVKAPTG